MSKPFSEKATNVRPGDRALCNGGHNAGRVVDVVREYICPEVLPGLSYHYGEPGDGKLRWVCESTGTPLKAVSRFAKLVQWSSVVAICDADLRPLRDNDQEDEMVSRVGRAPVSELDLAPQIPAGALTITESQETTHG